VNNSKNNITRIDYNSLDPNVEDSEGATPIHLAAFNGQADALEKLVEIEGKNISSMAKQRY
jgi:ankyrin repeat protein